MTRVAKAPAFQFFARDWLSSQSVALMSFAAQATYIRLLCHQFIGFFLPENPEEVRKLTGCTAKEWRTVWPELAPHFPVVEGGRANPKLAEQVRETAAYKSRRSNASAIANAARWGHDRPPTDTPPDPIRTPSKRPNRSPNRTPTPVRIGSESDSDSGPLQSAYCTTPPSSAAAEEVPPRGSGSGEPDATVAHAPWPDPTTAAAAAVLVAERGVTAAGLAAVCHGWAETGLDADRGQPVGWAPVAKAIRDYAGVEGKRWHAASFAGFVRSAVKAAAAAPPERVAAPPADTPHARCLALLAGEGFRAPVASWAAALGTDEISARRVVGVVAAEEEFGGPAPHWFTVDRLFGELRRLHPDAA